MGAVQGGRRALPTAVWRQTASGQTLGYFTEDVKAVADEVLVSHYTPDNVPKQSRKKLRVRGKIKLNAEGQEVYMQGDTARGSLHMQTFYGAVRHNGEIKYVVRKSLYQLQPADIEKIMDETVKRKVWKNGEEYRPIIMVYHTQLNACVEGYDFDITVTGEIKFRNWCHA